MSMSTLYTGILGYWLLSFETKGAIALPMWHNHRTKLWHTINEAYTWQRWHQNEAVLTWSTPHRRVVEHGW